MRILGFARLPDRALAVVADVLDRDGAFRDRVVATGEATEDNVHRAGVLFLTRPDGWAAELSELATAEAAAVEAVESTRADRDAARRVEQLESALARLTAEMDALRTHARGLTETLQAERDARRDAQAGRAALQDNVRRLERERDAAHRRVAAADALVANLRSQLETVQTAIERSDEDRSREHLLAVMPALRAALEDVARSNADATAAIDRALAVVNDATPRAPTRTRSARSRRTPIAVPPGIFADSPEMAEHLVRATRALVVVDGYNASLQAWPHADLAEQRHRLVDALTELAARTGAEVVVVFDGAGDAPTQSTVARQGVTVRFTDADVEADATIIDITETTDVARPVVVATDDQRVRDAVAAAGANLLTRVQLFSVLRRDLTP